MARCTVHGTIPAPPRPDPPRPDNEAEQSGLGGERVRGRRKWSASVADGGGRVGGVRGAWDGPGMDMPPIAHKRPVAAFGPAEAKWYVET